MFKSLFNMDHWLLSLCFRVLIGISYLTTLEGCFSPKMDSPRVTLLRVGGLIDGGDSSVKTSSWVKIVNGVITEIAPDTPKNRHFEKESQAPSTLYLDARKQILIPGFVGIFYQDLVSSNSTESLSEERLNDLLKLGITTLMVVSSDLSRTKLIQKYSIDAQRRTPRINIGSKITLKSPIAQEFRKLSNSPVETLWIEPSSQNNTQEVCRAAQEANFHEFKFGIVTSENIRCDAKTILTISLCNETSAKNIRCLKRNNENIGTLQFLSLDSADGSPIHEAIENLDSEIQKLSWGAAHLMGYQDAIGKIQIGYRGDLLLINPPALSPTGSAVIQKVFIDGIPQTIEPPSLISIFWFWKTVSLGL